MHHETAYRNLCIATREVALLQRVQDLLEWDEQTQMPPAGAAYRADQAAYLAGLVHQKQTAPEIGAWLRELAHSPLAAEPHGDTGTVIRCLQQDYEKKVRLPQSLVEELARLSVQGQQLWSEARQHNDFARFRPLLEKMVALKRQAAEALGYPETPYDALLDEYEPGASTADVSRVLRELRAALVPLVGALADSPQRPDTTILSRHYPIAAQQSLGQAVAATIGFDFSAGRLNVTEHPFCIGLGPGDVRITTRYNDHDFADGFYGILHEAGHGIYEQGLDRAHDGLPTGQDVSLGIHESQSRLWENQVGRSRPFWEYFYADAQAAFPQALADVPLDAFYGAVNDVRPSLIRTEADEVTYNLHILIRFELEVALIEDQLPVGDLPAAWNEKYQHYLGVTPPNDAVGVLQDVHWGAGLFGYFPTYALGNLYAAQFFAQAAQDLGDLEADFRQGQFAPLRQWLRQHVHQPGRRFTPAQLVQRITGQPLSHAPLISQLNEKYRALYGLS